MKKYVRYALLASSMVVMLSCSKDDPAIDPLDTEKPVITIVTPTTAITKVWGTVDIKAEATDNTGIAIINVFVDGASIASAASSPAEATWDSNLVSDGTHELKVVAEDKDGNATEVKFSFEVMNDLFTFKVSAEYIIEGYFEKWFFISDEQGNAIFTQQMENGKTYVLKTPTNYVEGSTYIISEFEFGEESNESYDAKFHNFTSYTHASPGEYIFHRTPFTKYTSQGKYRVIIQDYIYDINNSLGIFGMNIIPSGGSIVNYVDDHFEFTADLTSASSDLTFYLLPIPSETPKYLYLDNITSGGEFTVDYSSLSDMTLYTTLDLPGASETVYGLDAYSSTGKAISMYIDNRVYFGANPEAMEIWVPKLVYPRYDTWVTYDKGNDSYTYNLTDTQPPITIGEVTATVNSFSKTGNALSATLSEKTQLFKFYSGIYEETELNHTLNYSWSIYTEGNLSVSLDLPQIPTEILRAYPVLDGYEFTISSYELVNSSEWNGYQNYILKHFSVPVTSTGKIETMQKFQRLESSGGRKGNALGRRNSRNF